MIQPRLQVSAYEETPRVSRIEVFNQQFALVLGWASLVIVSVGLFPVVLIALDRQDILAPLLFAFLIIVETAAIMAIYRGSVRGGIFVLIAINLFSLLSPVNAAGMVIGVVAIMMAAAFTPRWLFLGVVALSIVRFTIPVVNLAVANPASLYDASLSRELGLVFALATVAIAARFFITNAQNAALSAERASSFLQAGAEIGQIAATTTTDLRRLLPEMANLIARRFNLYYVRIFLLDEAAAQLKLNAASGETTSQTTTRGEQPIAVGAPGAVGQAALRARLNIVRMDDPSTVREGWELHTHSQAAFPLMNGDRVVGVLDVQSRDDDAFAVSDIQALEIAVAQVANAIRSARSFDEVTRAADENRRLAADTQKNLQEIERLNRQLTGVAWQSYLERARIEASVQGVTLNGDRVVKEDQWTPTLTKAGLRGESVTTRGTGQPSVVAVPVMLRGEVIGAIEVEGDADAPPSEMIELTRAVADQLAVSLENARLYEETGYAAAQEQRINAIAARFQETTSVDDLLRVTLSELTTALGAERGAIRLTRITDAPQHDLAAVGLANGANGQQPETHGDERNGR
jgi:GAF domain-containing protein